MAWNSFIASGPEGVAVNDGTIHFPSKWLRKKYQLDDLNHLTDKSRIHFVRGQKHFHSNKCYSCHVPLRWLLLRCKLSSAFSCQRSQIK